MEKHGTEHGTKRSALATPGLDSSSPRLLVFVISVRRGMATSKSKAIGDAGEALFDQWGRLAGFKTPQPSPDEIGLDRLFEIPLEQPADVPLDSCPPSAVGGVQIKTTVGEKLSVQMSLDTCRKLVFRDEPTFILLIQIAADEQPRRAFLRHVDKDFGADVLAAVRRFERDGGTSGTLHKSSMSVRWGAVHEFEPCAAAVKRRLLALIGGPDSYAQRKSGWRRTVGFPERPFSLTVRATVEDIAGAYLGDRVQVPATVSEASTERFGIRLPVSHLIGEVKLTLGQKEPRTASLKVESPQGAVSLQGTLAVATPLIDSESAPPDIAVWKFTSGLFTMRGKAGKSLDLTVSTNEVALANLGRWCESATVLSMMGEGECRLALEVEGIEVSFGAMAGSMPEGLDSVLRIIATAEAFAADVGIERTVTLSGDDFWDWDEQRRGWLDFRLGEEIPSSLGFELEAEVDAIGSGTAEMLIPMWARLGSAYAVRACIVRFPWEPRSVGRNKWAMEFVATVTEIREGMLLDSPDAAFKTIERLTEQHTRGPARSANVQFCDPSWSNRWESFVEEQRTELREVED